jgi:hypothetical protein
MHPLSHYMTISVIPKISIKMRLNHPTAKEGLISFPHENLLSFR